MKNKDYIQEERKDESYSSIEKMKKKDYKHEKRKDESYSSKENMKNKDYVQEKRKDGSYSSREKMKKKMYMQEKRRDQIYSTKQKSIEVECKKRKREIINSLEEVFNIFHKKYAYVEFCDQLFYRHSVDSNYEP